MSPREGAVRPITSQLSLIRSDEGRLIVGEDEGGITSRFTYAHELAHWAAQTRLPEEFCSSWSADAVRQFCDEFASRVLVPSDLLLAMLPPAPAKPGGRLDLAISLIEELRRRLRAPMATVVKRINDAVDEGLIRVSDCAMLVCAGRSAKRNSDYAPRILTCCTPSEWFLPANKRLTTLGMLNLDRMFWEAPPLQEGFAVDRLTVWVRDGWRKESVERPIQYRIYAAASTDSAKRSMLSVFPGPD